MSYPQIPHTTDRRGEFGRHAELHAWAHARCLRPQRLGTPNLLASGTSRRLANEAEALAPRRPWNCHTPRNDGSWGLPVYGMASPTAPTLIATCLEIHDTVAIAGGLQMPLSRQRRHCLLGLTMLAGS